MNKQMNKPHFSKAVFSLLFLFGQLVSWSQADEKTIENTIQTLKDVTITNKYVRYKPYRLEYQLTVKQPIDHNDTSRGFFYQQVRLVHKDFLKPMVMETEGYAGRTNGNELEKILDCNDLNVEFRYFNRSKPDSLQWQYCTFEQATADLHHINQLFRTLYHSKWISTGISRGGETTLIYKYYYPGDIDASVPYVAPMPNDIEDKRIYSFLDTAGGVSCVKKIRALQIFLLTHEQEALKKISLQEKLLHYTSLGNIGVAYEYTVLEYPFSFWQITSLKEKDIPAPKNLDTCLVHLIKVFGDFAGGFSDEKNETFIPHYYMTYQTGYYKYNIKPFVKYLHYIKNNNPPASILPPAIPHVAYDPGFEKKINAWLYDNGNNILYIYGGRDTWSACKPEFGSTVNAKRFIIPGANHFEARIRNMSAAMQQEFGEALEKLVGVKANFSALK